MQALNKTGLFMNQYGKFNHDEGLTFWHLETEFRRKEKSQKNVNFYIVFHVLQNQILSQLLVQMKTNEPTSAKKQLRLQDFQIQYRLGQGAYGYVFLASRNFQEFAIKEMNKYKLTHDHKQYIPMVQKQLLKVMNHPGIIKSKYVFQNTNNLYLVMEYCSGNQLLTIIEKQLLTEDARRFYFAELINVIEYLHLNGIVHRDLKPMNILLSKEGHIKLIDFGTADITHSNLVSETFKEKILQMKTKKVQPESGQNSPTSPGKKGRILKRKSTFVGTTQFLSPQLVELSICTTASDLWALGCILYFTYYGFGPFGMLSEFESYQAIKNGIVEYPQNSKVSQQGLDLMKRLLVKNPEERLGSCSRAELSFQALRAHPFFKGLNVKDIFFCEPPKILTPQIQIQQKLKELKLQANLSYKQPNFDNIFQKLLVKIDENNEGIYLCHFKKIMMLEENEMLGSSTISMVYHLKKDAQGNVAHLLSETKFSIGVFERERLIYSSRDSKAICKRLNDYYSTMPEIPYKQCQQTQQA